MSKCYNCKKEVEEDHKWIKVVTAIGKMHVCSNECANEVRIQWK